MSTVNEPVAEKAAFTVALIGNPNTGKSTLFSALSGTRQRVGNYPGVTVEKRIGKTVSHGRTLQIVDLPGTYSLAPRSPDEMIAVDVLLGRQGGVEEPQAVLCIVDASNLERNLYLVSQVLELGRPTVLALNMVDVAREKGITIDVDRLRKQLHVPIVETQANKKIGLAELKAQLEKAVEAGGQSAKSPFPAAFIEEVDKLAAKNKELGGSAPRYLLERLLLDHGNFLSQRIPQLASLGSDVSAARERLAKAGHATPAVEAVARYQWVGEVLKGVVQRAPRPLTWSDRLDKILTHRFFGAAIFIILMMLMFQAVFYIAEPASWAIDWFNGTLSAIVARFTTEGPLQSLLISGVIEGVGGVLIFLPQIFILFLFIAILEDCGYMARAAYLMDKLMSRIGLSGKSFIPLLSSFACAIPGIMAARVIENRRDRLVTILVAPLMSCSARLPVYILLIAAFIPDIRYLGGLLGLKGLTMFAMYCVGIVAAVLVAFLLKKTILRGATPPFVMELPSYKIPGLAVVLRRMWEAGFAFVRRAGTLILAATILVWAAAYYPRAEANLDPALVQRQEALSAEIESINPENTEKIEALQAELGEVENQIATAHLENSFLGRAGHFIEPAVRPLGWDWKIGCAAIASFPAREVVIASLGVLYSLGDEVDEESEPLMETMKASAWSDTGKPVFTIPTVLSLMVFFALCAQCASTLAVMHRETGSWKWPVFSFVYMTTLAYLAALAVYQIGTALGG